MSDIKSWIDKQTGEIWFSDGSREVKADPLVAEGMWTLEKKRTKTLTDEIGRLRKIVEREGDDQLTKAGFKVEFPRRQAMLSIYEEHEPIYPWQNVSALIDYMQNRKVVSRVPVFVWPMPTQAGYFVVEHQDGSCTFEHPSDLTFLGSKELFDQYDWTQHD